MNRKEKESAKDEVCVSGNMVILVEANVLHLSRELKYWKDRTTKLIINNTNEQQRSKHSN